MRFSLPGVYTDECISTAARNAADYGFLVTLISDGCTTVTRERHEFTIATLKDRYTRILTTDEAVEEINCVSKMMRQSPPDFRHQKAQPGNNWEP